MKVEDKIRFKEVDRCCGLADPENFRFLSEWIAEKWYFIPIDANVDVDDVLVDVHVKLVHNDSHPDHYYGFVDSQFVLDSSQNG